MNTAWLIKPGTIQLREMPDPVPGAGEIVLRVESALTCGTALKAYNRGHPKIPMPGPFGHEFAGTVCLVGSGVEGFTPGDRVVALHTSPCGQCRYCRLGQTNLCREFDARILLGAFAEKITIPAPIVREYCFKIPASLPARRAAFLQSLSCVVHALGRLDPKPHESLCILGTGSFAILFALAAACRSLKPLILGRSPLKCQTLKHFGLDAVHSPEELARRLGGEAPRLVVEAVGTAESWRQAVDLVDRGGRVLWFGGLPPATEVLLDHHKVHYGEVQLVNAFHYTRPDVEEARELLFSRLDPEFLIADTLPLKHLEAAFHSMNEGRGLKYEIQP